VPAPARADVVVCGAGIAGLAAAWHLAARRGVRRVVIVDERPPLSLTSDKSTECYRNWWPDRPMIELVGRSIELLDEMAASTDNAISLNRNGYLFATATAAGAAALEREARERTALGAGPLRVHRGTGDPGYAAPAWDRPAATADGADLFLDPAEIARRFPVLAPGTRAALHTRRCGWLSAQQLGMQFLERARAAGATLVEARLVGIELEAGRVRAVRLVRGGLEERLETSVLVDAAGPYADDVARLAGVELPLSHELHLKVTFDDDRRAIPRELPLVCWNDPVRLDWTPEERAGLADDPAGRALLDEVPAGVHFRPEGGADGTRLLLLWTYDARPGPRRYPFAIDPLYLPVVLRGVARVAPAFAVYLERGRKPYLDGGYYTKTPENRPLIGPLDPERARGAYALCALSGFGIMASPAAAELLAAHVLGEPLPDWHTAFLPGRYRDPGYLATLADLPSGQL
jgi:glycine/D-amino acid oxidase-like deaminating enzyme